MPMGTPIDHLLTDKLPSYASKLKMKYFLVKQ